MRILVTGGTGFVGRVLVLKLLDAGYDVTVLSRGGTADVDVLRADLRDKTEVAAAVRQVKVEGVCHLAARTRIRESFADPVGYYDTNLTGTANLLAALGPEPIPFVFASTCAVYGLADHPVTEDDATTPGNPYASSKLTAEQLIGYQAARGSLAAVSLRCFNAAGAMGGIRDTDLTRLIPRAIAVAAGAEGQFPLNGDGSAIREFTHVEDVADACLLALRAARPGRHLVFNVGSGQGVPVREVLSAIEELTGRKLPIRRQPAQNEPRVLMADSSRLRAQLGWQSRRSDLRRILHDAWEAVSD
jgi:UDP-glucose 4-epimerase